MQWNEDTKLTEMVVGEACDLNLPPNWVLIPNGDGFVHPSKYDHSPYLHIAGVQLDWNLPCFSMLSPSEIALNMTRANVLAAVDIYQSLIPEDIRTELIAIDGKIMKLLFPEGMKLCGD